MMATAAIAGATEVAPAMQAIRAARITHHGSTPNSTTTNMFSSNSRGSRSSSSSSIFGTAEAAAAAAAAGTTLTRQGKKHVNKTRQPQDSYVHLTRIGVGVSYRNTSLSPYLFRHRPMEWLQTQLVDPVTRFRATAAPWATALHQR